VWHFHNSVELLDLVKGVDTWRKSSVKAEDVSLNDSSQWKIVKERSEVLPNVCISVFSKALIVEAIDLSNLLGLVVTSQDGDSVWISDLEGYQESDGLNRVVASVNVVAHEQVVVVWQLTSNFEKFFQIVELSMDVTADSDWGSNRLHIAFFHKDLLGLLAESFDIVLSERLALK